MSVENCVVFLSVKKKNIFFSIKCDSCVNRKSLKDLYGDRLIEDPRTEDRL